MDREDCVGPMKLPEMQKRSDVIDVHIIAVFDASYSAGMIWVVLLDNMISEKKHATYIYLQLLL